jgi:hypothetical protein
MPVGCAHTARATHKVVNDAGCKEGDRNAVNADGFLFLAGFARFVDVVVIEQAVVCMPR